MLNYKKISTLIVLFGSCYITTKIKAQDIKILTENVPGEVEKSSNGKVTGIFAEIVTQALESQNIKYEFIWTRWKLAQQKVQENADKKSFILPITRIPEREKNYIWVAKICDIETFFITKKGNKKINSLKEINDKKIGVQVGTSYEQKILNQKGKAFKDEVSSVPYDQLNVKRLLLGEIFAWYTSSISGKANIVAEKIDLSQFEYGNKIDVEENYISTTSKTDPKLIERVAKAFEQFRKTNKYSEIIKKYVPNKN
ncbi:substrate-binding periplasmic protein [Pigmentibacter ruber]|uniref:substrate-binding periplasmic protein n=1 Tax=Pigmentibacter ruber TaxID=2683196 RepID=UPI00131C6DA4|nr:transporter substrate-binding domain-containing protein [Pigmentibacter ruber]